MLDLSITYLKELTDVQQKLNAPKTQKNTFGGYNFRSAEDILLAVKPLLAANNAQIIINDLIEVHGPDRFYIKSTATFVCESGKVSSSAYAREPLTKKGFDESQITGAASSYARKYALNGLLLIDDNKDADHNSSHVYEGKVVSKSYANQKKHIPIKPSNQAKIAPIPAPTLEIKTAINDLCADFEGTYKLSQSVTELKDLFAASWTSLAKYKNSYASDKMADIKKLYDQQKAEIEKQIVTTPIEGNENEE